MMTFDNYIEARKAEELRGRKSEECSDSKFTASEHLLCSSESGHGEGTTVVHNAILCKFGDA